MTDLQNKVIESGLSNLINVDEKFSDLSIAEIIDYFEDSFAELEYLVSFDLLSATEAALRNDFLLKVSTKGKSNIARRYREISKEKEDKISLEQDILETLKILLPSKRTIFSSYLSALKYRHWIAHGRYWNPKLGRSYTVDIVFKIASDTLDAITA